jgi:cyanate lyase
MDVHFFIDRAQTCLYNLYIRTIQTYKTMTKKMTKTIKKALIDQDKSITELAKEIGYTRGYVSNVINGHFTNPPAEVVKLIFKALELEDPENKHRAA